MSPGSNKTEKYSPSLREESKKCCFFTEAKAAKPEKQNSGGTELIFQEGGHRCEVLITYDSGGVICTGFPITAEVRGRAGAQAT